MAKAKRSKIGKIAIVVFITMLIWIWADLALDELLPDRQAVITIDQGRDSRLWVRFGDNNSSRKRISVTLSGPHSLISEQRRRIREGDVLEFNFDAEKQNMAQPGSYENFPLLAFLQADKELTRQGLKIVAVEPAYADIHVEQMEKRSLPVYVLDEHGNSINEAMLDPAEVEMFVPVYWSGSQLRAMVQLSDREIKQARLDPIQREPYIELGPGEKHFASRTVEVITPPEASQLSEYRIQGPTLGLTLSTNLQGRYKVEILNEAELIGGAVSIRATPEAKLAYENSRFHLMLEIDDGDARSTDALRRELVYAFPRDYVQERSIYLNQPPVTARFRLVPLKTAE